MQTPERITGRPARKADYKSKSEPHSLWSRPEQKNYSAQRCCNSFLKTTFHSSVPGFILKDLGHETVNIITQENYRFLRDSYMRYARLLNAKAEHSPGKTLNESINQLYYDMQTLLPDNVGLNIEHEDGRLYFTLWKCHKWGNCQLYFFPVKFLTGVNAELRRIAISFLNRFMHANGIGTILDCDEHEYMMECVYSDYDPKDPDPEQRQDRRRIESYQKGVIYTLLRRVDRKSYHDDIPGALRSYTPQNGWESKLINAMLDGLEFLNPEKAIMEYAYDPFYEEEPDIRPISLDRQICVVYEEDDIVTRIMTDYINSDYQESYEILPISTLKLTPQTESLFTVTDKYPERFFQWADRFISIIR